VPGGQWFQPGCRGFEVGGALPANSRGKGYAGEAARAAIDLGALSRPSRRLNVHCIDQEKHGVQAVARASGEKQGETDCSAMSRCVG